MATTSNRRTAEQLAAHHQAKANKARARAAKLARALDTRRKILIGAGLMGMADAGDAAAARLVDRIKAHLIQPHDRAAFGLDEQPEPKAVAAPAAPTEVELTNAIGAAYAKHQATVTSTEREEAAVEWRAAVLVFERHVGRFWTKEDPATRRTLGLGGLGELAPNRAAQDVLTPDS